MCLNSSSTIPLDFKEISTFSSLPLRNAFISQSTTSSSGEEDNHVAGSRDGSDNHGGLCYWLVKGHPDALSQAQLDIYTNGDFDAMHGGDYRHHLFSDREMLMRQRTERLRRFPTL
ncbi:hypothetical protein U1Q18_001946 [Sarracenia purpurea var. burkii]